MYNLFSDLNFRRFCCLTVFLLSLDSGSCLWKPKGLRLIGSGKLNKGRGWSMYQTSNGCPLSPLETFPYAVKVWSDGVDAHLYVKTAAILSHKAVITHCTGLSQYTISTLILEAQRNFIAKNTNFRTCMQSRSIKNIYPHPKCNKDWSHEDNKFFDYQIFELHNPFDAEKEFAYPTLPIHKQPYDLMQFIRKVMVLGPNYDGCEVPIFALRDQKFPIFEVSSLVIPEAYSDMKCVNDLCNLLSGMRDCRARITSYANYTFMCVSTSYRKKYDSETALQPHHGAPIVCNNSAIGMVTFNVYRAGKSEDYLLVSTYLRVWPWLMKMKHRYWDFFYNREKWDSPFLEFRPWREWTYTTPRWDKDLSVADYQYFKFINDSPTAKPRSGGSRLRAVFINYIFATLIPIIVNI